MADGLENDGGQIAAPQGRPLWVAALAAALTAVFVALIGILIFLVSENDRMAGCDGCILAPDPLTFEWWAFVAPLLPYIVFVAVVFAVSLMAIMAFLERRPSPRRLPWFLAGVLAVAPLACVWLVINIIEPPADPARAFSVPFVCLVVIGLIGGAVAGAVSGRARA